MNSRERALAILLICVIVLGGGGFFGYQFVYVPYTARAKDLERLKKDEEAKRARLFEIEKQRGKLARWRSLSLPANEDVARLEYEKYLTQLFARHKIVTGREITPRNVDTKSSPTVGPNKERVYTRLTFAVKAYATLDNLVAMLEEFYKTGLMHEIKNLSIQRQLTTTTQGPKADELDVRMTVEALIVAGADKRSYLVPNFDRRLMLIDLVSSVFKTSPTVLWASVSPGLSSPGLLAEPPRYYASIGKKNIFLGNPPKQERPQQEVDDGTPVWMAPRFVHLTDITSSTLRTEAMVFDLWTNQKVKLREFSDAYKTFPFVRDPQMRAVVNGSLAKIDERDIFYRAEFKVGEDAGDPPISRPSKADQEKLVKDGTIKKDDVKGVLRVEPNYWDMLMRTQVVKKSARDKDGFLVELERDTDKPVERTFGSMDSGAPIEVLRGKVLNRDDKYVYILPEERYYGLHIGQSIEDSLKKPLPSEKVKELKEVAAN